MSQPEGRRGMPDRGNSVCKGPEMEQTVVSSRNKTKAVLKVVL